MTVAAMTNVHMARVSSYKKPSKGVALQSLIGALEGIGQRGELGHG